MAVSEHDVCEPHYDMSRFLASDQFAHEHSNSRVWPSWSRSSPLFPEGSLVGVSPLSRKASHPSWEAVPLSREASRLSPQASTLSQKASPLSRLAIPLSREASPLSRKASPLSREAFPLSLGGLPSVTGGLPSVTGGLPSGTKSSRGSCKSPKQEINKKIVYTSRFVRVILAQGPC